ncbi:MAG TPA: helix-turn-helix domain-containing protein [Solirubrobacteraceae bacterium]|nr:helix-turn-helix domain-containing protein [Solirubrobacteraceae bacterium]
MQELADALAERLGAPVAIEDRRYRMLAYSAHAEAPDQVRLTSILTREAPAELAAWLDAQGLPDAQAPVRLAPPPALGMGPRVAVPIPGRLGYVWLVDDGRVGEVALAAAAETAGAAAAAIRARRAAERTERALVAGLLRGEAEAAAALRDRGLRGPVRVVVGPDLDHRRLVAGEQAALFAGTDAELDALGLVLGASAPRDRLEAVPAALQEARLAASLRGRGRVVRWERLGALQLLAPLAGAPVPEPLARLLPHPELVETLEAYLDRAGDAQAAAAALFIHRTTLYHRLRRIERIAGADLRDGDDRLLLHMALRLRALG